MAAARLCEIQMRHHRTPLRYPGGKQRLAPFIAELLAENQLIGGHYVEPYAGGAGVALELLLNGSVSHIHLNDSSFPIYAFWKSVLDHSEEMCQRIISASLCVEEWKKQRDILRNPTACNEMDLGFSTLYLNRCNRSGVLTGGLIGGLAQTGMWRMDARFPRNELVRRIEVIAAKRDSITLRNLDAETFILNYIPSLPDKTLVYCDPPYFTKSSRLYLDYYKENDHSRVAKVIQEHLSRKWVVSYDSAPEILGYYSKRQAFLYSLQYNASRVYKGQEVFIFSDDLTVPSDSSLPNIDTAIKADKVTSSQVS